MPNEIENTLKQTAQKISDYIADAASLTVETKFVTVSAEGGPAEFASAKPAARTIIKLDGDCEAILPMQNSDVGLTVDRSLFELHERSVASAIEYRTKVLNTLLDTLKSLR